MTQVLEARETYSSLFKKVANDLPGAGLDWVSKIRQGAIDRFFQLGFPTDNDEAWRFTNVDAIARAHFSPSARPESPATRVVKEVPGLFDSYRLVFIDGHYASDLSSLPSFPGLYIGSLAASLETKRDLIKPFLEGTQGGVFAALNAAFFTDGALVWLSPGVKLDKPIQLIFISIGSEPATMSPTRALIVAEKGACAVIVEYYYGVVPKSYFVNAVTEIVLKENARIDHYKIQGENEQSFHVAATSVRQGRDSRYFSHSTSLGGALVRNDINVSLEAEGADCTLNGLYLAKGRQHVDNHTFIDHAAPHGTSRELYKGILDDAAHAVFSGTIQVRPAAQKTSARVYNKNLLLSDQGLVNTKPEFKIYANDIQCKHGATIGQLSNDALFYLRSRGLGALEARRLLVHAFAGEMLGLIELPPLKETLDDLLSARLPESARS